MGKPCNDNSDCPTTDPTGRTGTCYCKDWWDAANSKYCLPVVGDLKNRMQTVRDLEQFKADNCGKFYTEEECLEEFSPTMRDLKDKVEGEIQVQCCRLTVTMRMRMATSSSRAIR